MSYEKHHFLALAEFSRSLDAPDRVLTGDENDISLIKPNMASWKPKKTSKHGAGNFVV